MMKELIELDYQLLIFLNNLGNTYFDAFWLSVSKTWIWVPLYIILAYFLYKNFGLRSLIFILIFIALGVTISDQISGIFKHSTQRLRPCHNPNLEGLIREVACGGKFSFYSAHASNTFFLALFMFQMLRKNLPLLCFLLIFWAIMVSYSRIYLGVHFPSDVLTGSILGGSLGLFFAFLSQKVIKKQNASLPKK